MNVKDNDGFTALIRAAYLASFKCIEHLLNAGADVNEMTKGGVTALLMVCRWHSEFRCRELIEKTGNSYVSENQSVLKTIEALINAGADVNIRDAAGNAPFVEVVYLYHECIPVLLAAGADVNIRDGKTGSSALMIAIMEDRDEAFEELMKGGADVNIVNSTGATALLIAAVLGNVRVTRRLLKANCRINNTIRVSDKELMLRFKGRPEHGDVVRLLFSAGEIFILSNMITHGNGDFDWIARYFRNTTSRQMQLAHICRVSIRDRLLKLDLHQHLFNRIPRLGLPELLKRYLLYDESPDDDKKGDGDNN